MNIADIKSMNAEEKLEAINLLWSELLKDKEDPRAPNWHEDILKKRLQSLEEGKTKLLNLDQLQKYREG